MKDSEAIYQQIESYLSQEMGAEERLGFEQQLAQDPELQAELTLYRELQAAVGETEVRNFSAILAQADDEYVAETQNKTPVRSLFQRYAYVALAAAIALLIGIFFLWQPGPAASSQELFAANYEAPAIRLTLRGDSSSSLLQQAIETYQTQQYEAAIQYLSELEQLEPGKVDYSFYKGVAYLSSQQSREAIETFDQVLQQAAPGSAFLPMAQWYRSLALLADEDLPAARTALQAIADSPTHFYREKAQEILKSLE